MMRSLLLAALAVLSALFAAPPAIAAEALAIRAYPSGVLHTYPLESLRKVQGLMVQNIAVINTSGAPQTLERIEIELMSGQEAVDRRTLQGESLDRLAAGTYQLQATGQVDAVGFLFGDVLGTPRARIASSRTLKPGEALLLAQQVFAWKGARDAVRITAHAMVGGKPVRASLTLAIAPPTSEARYVFPLEGRWYIGAGPTLHSHHRWVTSEEFALDIVKVGDGGLTYRGDPMVLASYYAYGATVRAAAEGEVVAVVDSMAEDTSWIRRPDETQGLYMIRVMQLQSANMATGADNAAGNRVVIRHPWGEYSMYAHLQPGSVLVKVGDKVTARQPLAKLGTSGGSTEPHLHFQICDGPGPLDCAGLPATFKDLDLPGADYARPPQTGDFVESK